MNNLPKLFVGLDYHKDILIEHQFNSININELKGKIGIKLNLDHIMKASVKELKNICNQFPTFFDFKMFNGKRTMIELVLYAARCNAKLISIHPFADRFINDVVEVANDNDIKVLCTTVLTHFNDNYCERYFYYVDVYSTINHLIRNTIDYNLHGYIIPGNMLDICNKDILKDKIKFCPAVRPTWYESKNENFQKQIVAPLEAIKNGANIISCHSPIFKTSNQPDFNIFKILEEIENE